MRVVTALSSDLRSVMRLDSKFFLERAKSARICSTRHPTVSVRDTFGDNVVLPNIFERVPAGSPEFGKPILVPYDAFRYIPYSNDLLSRSQVSIFDRLELKRGWMLIVCSGRNLGPVTFVDKYLERFVMSHDMIRICVEPNEDLFYFAAVMHTQVGQALIRTDRNGSVIDHLDANQVSALRYPIVSPELRKASADALRRAFELREAARLALESASTAFLQECGLAEYEKQFEPKDDARRFTVLRSSIRDRFDSEPFAPRYARFRELFNTAGKSERIGDLALVFKPVGRYRTMYVESEEFGVRLLSGRQIAQSRPIAAKIMSRKAWIKPEEYLLEPGMVLLTSDGRAEENLADCAMVQADRAGWAASGHVHRLVARSGVHPGLLYLVCSCKPVQELLKSLATGSVVDALSVSDVQSVPVPFPTGKRSEQLGDQAVQAWKWFSEATQIEDEAVRELEAELVDNRAA